MMLTIFSFAATLVLAVGGVQEKLLAAQRSGIKTVVVPSACRADIEHNVREFSNVCIRKC